MIRTAVGIFSRSIDLLWGEQNAEILKTIRLEIFKESFRIFLTGKFPLFSSTSIVNNSNSISKLYKLKKLTIS
ncbi:hypothetical protein BpHYR1_028673 [Brachionus plicatilis]|uniref:Uncharacterized protein n=1 Tax=Brachionus plicatilis TaxID=10195 RepID=A0A3M7TA67_BRAPC|nr:hypothetical protein BpHYR1_028673 [Brachionus plicatilis]